MVYLLVVFTCNNRMHVFFLLVCSLWYSFCETVKCSRLLVCPHVIVFYTKTLTHITSHSGTVLWEVQGEGNAFNTWSTEEWIGEWNSNCTHLCSRCRTFWRHRWGRTCAQTAVPVGLWGPNAPSDQHCRQRDNKPVWGQRCVLLISHAKTFSNLLVEYETLVKVFSCTSVLRWALWSCCWPGTEPNKAQGLDPASHRPPCCFPHRSNWRQRIKWGPECNKRKDVGHKPSYFGPCLDRCVSEVRQWSAGLLSAPHCLADLTVVAELVTVLFTLVGADEELQVVSV